MVDGAHPEALAPTRYIQEFTGRVGPTNIPSQGALTALDLIGLDCGTAALRGGIPTN